MTTLVDLKNRKAVLESCIEIETVADGDVSDETFVSYMAVCAQLKFAEEHLLHHSDIW